MPGRTESLLYQTVPNSGSPKFREETAGYTSLRNYRTSNSHFLAQTSISQLESQEMNCYQLGGRFIHGISQGQLITCLFRVCSSYLGLSIPLHFTEQTTDVVIEISNILPLPVIPSYLSRENKMSHPHRYQHSSFGHYLIKHAIRGHSNHSTVLIPSFSHQPALSSLFCHFPKSRRAGE